MRVDNRIRTGVADGIVLGAVRSVVFGLFC
jgi:hypothetical protein